MEQKSDVKFRAEKLYKNSKEKFGYLLREVVSNSIHAIMIRKKNELLKEYNPVIDVKITIKDTETEIVVHDNGEGFTELNRRYFTHLDTRNIQKEELNFHPKGQGRLAIIFFSDYANYNSVYKGTNGQFKHKSFDYPEISSPLFDIEGSEGTDTEKVETETTLTLRLTKTQTLSRANTFFRKYSDIDKIKNWFIENFFPFLIENDTIDLNIAPVSGSGARR